MKMVRSSRDVFINTDYIISIEIWQDYLTVKTTNGSYHVENEYINKVLNAVGL